MKAWMFLLAAGLVLAAGMAFTLPDFWKGLVSVTFILLLVCGLYSNK